MTTNDTNITGYYANNTLKVKRDMQLNKKGISPVIAVLLLIVIAVAAAILVYVWLSGYMGTLQSQAGTQQVQERIKIEGVKISSNQIEAIYIRNIGDVSVTIDAIYLLDSSGNIKGVKTGIGATILSASVYEATTADFGSSAGEVGGATLTAGNTYIIKVVTSRGTEVTYQFTYRT